MSKTFVIAEIGSNHGGDFAQITKGLAQAAAAGADCAKLQWTSDPQRMAERRGAGRYADVYDRFLSWPEEWHGEVRAKCDALGIGCMCTVFLPCDVAVVAPHVARFKIASFEAMDAELLEAHRPYEQPVLISAGMLNEAEVVELHFAANQNGAELLHCVSAYPVPIEEMGLALIRTGLYAGISDHSIPSATITGALAVAAGARIVEAHVRINGQDPTLPDYPHAMSEYQFREYVENIRIAELAVGEIEPRRQRDCERAMAPYRVGNMSE